MHLPAPPVLQTKLAVNQLGDDYKQETDRAAEQVMRMTTPAQAPSGAAGEQPGHEDQQLQRKPVGSNNLGLTIAPPIVNEVLRSPGQPLAPTTRAFMEARFGHNFSNVRVVDDAESHAAARTLDANAFVTGDTVFLGDSAPPLGSPARERLLAHELAHVVQQREAPSVDAGSMSTPGDMHERAAETAAHRAARGEPARVSAAVGGAPPAVQRDSTLKITKRLSDMSRAEVQQVLQEFFEKTMKAQGGKSVSMTEDVKNTIRRILLNDMPGLMKLDSYLGRSIFPGSPAELAAAIAAYLPDPLEASRLAHLGASSGPGPTKMERVGDLVKKTEPFESPDTLEQKWKFDRETTQLRKGEGAVGPFGVDLNRIFNVGKGLPGALKTPPSQTMAGEARSYPQVNAVIDKISKTLLVPAEAKGTSNADNFADAQLVAQDLARQLDIAHQQKNDSITLQLTPNYNGVRDRVDMIREVIKLVQLIRDALPHQASGVSTVDLYFGDRLVQRISLTAKAE
jgi:Domain of unknown function (DUF4157)